MENLFKFLFLIGFIFLSPQLSFSQKSLFETGQEAEVILSPYGDGSNAQGLYNPSRAFSDGTRLYVSDTRNNRVLIWNTIPTRNYQPADVVVGQPDFTSNYSSGGASGLCWPMGVHSDGQRLFIADAGNSRVLIWNHIPTTNGEPADLVLGQPELNKVGDPEVTVEEFACLTHWPWDVHFDGTRLYVVCTLAGRVLIWNQLPEHNYQPADLVIGKKDFNPDFRFTPTPWSLGTPRSICVDGNRIAVGDYNGHRILIWNSIPTQNGQDADIVLLQNNFYESNEIDSRIIDPGHYGIWIKDGKLFLAGVQVSIWDSIPSQNGQLYDRKVGFGKTLGAGIGVCYDGQHLITSGLGSRVLIYNSLPESDTTLADVVLGQPDFDTDLSISAKGFGNAGGIASTGKKLMVAGDARICIFQNLPSKDGEEADNIISQYDFNERTLYNHGPFGPLCVSNQIWSDGVRLLMADGVAGILVWNQIPQEDHVFYDYKICPDNNCGNIKLSNPMGLTVKGDTLYVSDANNQQILIWYSIPKENDLHDPDLIIKIPDLSLCHISTDGKRLAVGSFGGNPPIHSVLIWNSIPTYNDQQPDIKLRGVPQGFNMPMSAIIHENQLFVNDLGSGRICIYNTFPTHESQPYDVVLGQDDFESKYSGMSRKKLYNILPSSFDGEYLWIGEFKFSSRVLGFRANIEPTIPNSPSLLTATSVSNNQINLSWSDNSSNERGFIIKYKKSGEEDYRIWNYLTYNSTSYTIGKLDPNTEYSFVVQSYNSYGESDNSNIATVSTKNNSNSPPNIPSYPFPINGDIYSNTMLSFLSQIKLQWLGEDPDIGDVVSYDLYIGNNPDPPLIGKKLNQNYFMNLKGGFPAEEKFYWRVVATDLKGTNSEGPIWTFTTVNAGGNSVVVNINTGDGGTTMPKPGSYIYDNRNKTLIFALPEQGQIFSHWTGDVPEDAVYNNPLVLDLIPSKSIMAHFIADTISTGNKITAQLNQSGYILSQNYPNPFDRFTEIKYRVPENGLVEIIIYDMEGRKVRNLVSRNESAGYYSVVWDGKNNDRVDVGSGIYICTMVSGKYKTSKKITLLR